MVFADFGLTRVRVRRRCASRRIDRRTPARAAPGQFPRGCLMPAPDVGMHRGRRDPGIRRGVRRPAG